ncbi:MULTISPECIES: METTL5 family protein [Sulfolobaceae]|uniref:METTL5 family protein n=1 Tax=Sulfolobaceae TaxID=118883 RepID=UPI002795E090|nr:methyltransferase domain-containing protein [Sulfolobus sp. B1]
MLDAGCGTGIFCLAVTLLGGYCVCVDIDLESLKVAKEMFNELGLLVDLVNVDIRFFKANFDVVIQNPPFGVVNKGIDIQFLISAFNNAKIIYSIHKFNRRTREIITNLAKERGFKVSVITEKYRLKQYYPWHKERFHEFLVDVYLFTKIL